MIVGVTRENFPGERRVSLVPASVPHLTKAGMEVLVETGAGQSAGLLDAAYQEKGAKIAATRDELFAQADIIFQVRCLGANPENGREDLPRMKKGQIVIGSCDPLGEPAAITTLAQQGVSLFALEMIPRITRAQSMDVLSSQATIAGYRAVLLAAIELPKMFPMLMTAAGTLSPARVFVIGAGVAGLQAIATAKRLGAIVSAYDVRPEAAEQIESLGGKTVQLDLETGQSQDKGGYAKDLGEEFYTRQRELMGKVAGESDVVITTAAIPGRPSPLLISEEGILRMAPGSVAVDLAAQRGGNIAPSKPDERVEINGITILGPTNLPSEIPNHASQMLSNNITKFLLNMVDKEKKFSINLKDEIVAGTLVAKDGEVVHARIREMLSLTPLEPKPADEPAPTPSPTGETEGKKDQKA